MNNNQNSTQELLKILSSLQSECHRLKWEQEKHEVGSQEFGRYHFLILDNLENQLLVRDGLEALEKITSEQMQCHKEIKLLEDSLKSE